MPQEFNEPGRLQAAPWSGNISGGDGGGGDGDGDGDVPEIVVDGERDGSRGRGGGNRRGGASTSPHKKGGGGGGGGSSPTRRVPPVFNLRLPMADSSGIDLRQDQMIPEDVKLANSGKLAKTLLKDGQRGGRTGRRDSNASTASRMTNKGAGGRRGSNASNISRASSRRDSHRVFKAKDGLGVPRGGSGGSRPGSATSTRSSRSHGSSRPRSGRKESARDKSPLLTNFDEDQNYSSSHSSHTTHSHSGFSHAPPSGSPPGPRGQGQPYHHGQHNHHGHSTLPTKAPVPPHLRFSTHANDKLFEKLDRGCRKIGLDLGGPADLPVVHDVHEPPTPLIRYAYFPRPRCTGPPCAGCAYEAPLWAGIASFEGLSRPSDAAYGSSTAGDTTDVTDHAESSKRLNSSRSTESHQSGGGGGDGSNDGDPPHSASLLPPHVFSSPTRPSFVAATVGERTASSAGGTNASSSTHRLGAVGEGQESAASSGDANAVVDAADEAHSGHHFHGGALVRKALQDSSFPALPASRSLSSSARYESIAPCSLLNTGGFHCTPSYSVPLNCIHDARHLYTTPVHCSATN